MAAYFDTMADELAAYPMTDVKLEIVDVITPGSVLNVGEEPSFYVRVTNTGPLRLTGVTVRVRGQNGATVKHGGALAQFASDFVSDELPPINAHGVRCSVPAAPSDSRHLAGRRRRRLSLRRRSRHGTWTGRSS